METIANSGWFIPVLIAVMAIGLIGLLFYIIPGLTIIWLAVLAYGIVTGFNVSSGILFAVITLLMIGGNIVDNLTMGKEARKTGASWLGIAVALGSRHRGDIYPAALRRAALCPRQAFWSWNGSAKRIFWKGCDPRAGSSKDAAWP
jgi:hypothetical protein